MNISKLKCPKCGNPLGKGDPTTQSKTCMNCGKTIRGTHELHALIQANGKEIAKDYEAKPLSEVLYKWGISSKALYNIPEIIEIRSKYPKFRHITKTKNTLDPILEERSNGHIPQMPIFNDKWTPEVQLKWLGIYEIILAKEDRKTE